MAMATGINLGKALCDALGIDRKGRKITGLTLTADVDDVARVEVREIVEAPSADGWAKFEQVASRYTLTPAELVRPPVDPDAPHVVEG